MAINNVYSSAHIWEVKRHNYELSPLNFPNQRHLECYTYSTFCFEAFNSKVFYFLRGTLQVDTVGTQPHYKVPANHHVSAETL